MTEFTLPVSMPAALLRAVQHGESRRSASDRSTHEAQSTPTAFTIALSREVGARGTSVARELGQRLGWPVYDQELVKSIAEEMHVHTSLLESVDERHKDWLEERVEALCAVPTVSEAAFVRRLVQTLLSLAAHGECVIVGRGSPHVLPSASTLKVRLVAALEDRVSVMAQELGVSREKAAKHIADADRQRTRFIKEHFFADPSDPQHYNLVINTSRWTVRECADLVLAALERLQARSRMGS